MLVQKQVMLVSWIVNLFKPKPLTGAQLVGNALHTIPISYSHGKELCAKVPAEHSSHSEARSLSLKVPTGQAWHWVDPGGMKVPAEQGTHSVAPEGLQVPGTHLTQAPLF